MDRNEIIQRSNALSHRIIGAAIEVHRETGPGMLESTYEKCLCHELTLRGLDYQRQLCVPLKYKGIEVESGYRLDILVDGLVIVELKAIEAVEAIHLRQLTTYLKLTGLYLGLLINFNDLTIKDGLNRIVN